MYKILFTLMAALLCTAAFAQRPDTVKLKNQTDLQNRRQDSLTSKPFVPKVKTDKVYHPDSTHSPHTAVMRSLKIPGWGQVYNKQWWKVPLIYGGLGTLGYYTVANYKLYKEYSREAVARRNGDTSYTNHSKYRNITGGYAQFETAANGQSRNYQLCILGLAAVWGVNVIDAYIQAKFIHSYSMDNNFSVKVTPTVLAQPLFASNNIATFTPTLKVTLTLK